MIITISRKPFKGSVIDHIEINGCGAINLDKCRIPTEGTISQRKGGGDARGQYGMKHTIYQEHEKGRYPLNLLLSKHTKAVISKQSEHITSIHSASSFFKVLGKQ